VRNSAYLCNEPREFSRIQSGDVRCCRAALRGCLELRTVGKEQNTPSGQKKIDKHN